MKNTSIKDITLFALLLSFVTVNAGERDYMILGSEKTHFLTRNVTKENNTAKGALMFVRQQSEFDKNPGKSDLFPANVGKMFENPTKLQLTEDQSREEDTDDSFTYSSSSESEDTPEIIKSPQASDGGGDSLELSSSSESES